MAYLTYGRDVRKSLNGLKGPARKWAKLLVTIRDPFKLFSTTFQFVFLMGLAGLKICFFTMRRIINC
jgi:hypothetical protein